VTRVLIVNADDFGQTAGVTRGIVEAHERGIVTSASLMVRFEAAAEAAAYARRDRDLSVGLHVDFGEWTVGDEGWEPIYTLPSEDPQEVSREVERQLEVFRALVGKDPTHLDSHQHAHREEPVKSSVLELGRALGVPVRHFSPQVRYLGNFYGQGEDAQPYGELIRVPALTELLRSLEQGVTELGCHPGYAEGLASSYVSEREAELETLCDPRVRGVLAEEGIELRSFRDALSSV
jgi:chitin disaccharide deacetylase